MEPLQYAIDIPVHMTTMQSALILTCSLCMSLILALQLSSTDTLNVSSPTQASMLVGDDDPRFNVQFIYGETDLPVTPVYMNIVELMAQIATMGFLDRVRQRHGTVLPAYPQVEIAVLPAPPATTVEVRLLIWALYSVALDMTYRNKFKEVEVPFSWDGDVVAYLYFTIPEASGSGESSGREIIHVDGIANSTKIVASSGNISSYNNLGVGEFGWDPVYKPDGHNLLPKDVFILTMGALKAVAEHPVNDKIQWPFHVSSEMINAHIEVRLPGRGVPRTRPPYFQYGHIIEAARRVPGWMLQRRKFAEAWLGIRSNSRSVGLVTYLRGPYQWFAEANVTAVAFS